MLHGASGNAADLFLALADRLAAAGFRVLSADRPGHGWSDRFGGRDGASPRFRPTRCAGRRKRSGSLGGGVVHSLGGLAGLAMALDHPDFVRALVLISPVSHPWPGGVAWYYRSRAHPLARAAVPPAGHLARGPSQDARGRRRGVRAEPAAAKFHRRDRAAAGVAAAPFPRQLRGCRWRRSGRGGAVAALWGDPRADRGGDRRFGRRRLRPHPLGGSARDIPGARLRRSKAWAIRPISSIRSGSSRSSSRRRSGRGRARPRRLEAAKAPAAFILASACARQRWSAFGAPAAEKPLLFKKRGSPKGGR